MQGEMKETSQGVTKDANGRPQLRMTRTFDAPARLVWEAWSNAEYLARWFTPKPGTSHDVTVDLRPGGDFILTMRFPDGSGHTMHAKFVEVIPQKRISFDCVVHGLDVHTTIDFSEKNGKTTLNVLQRYSGENEATQGAHAGWTSSLDNLAAVVREIS